MSPLRQALHFSAAPRIGHGAKGCFLIATALILAGSLGQAATNELRGWWVDAFHEGIKSPAEVRQLVADARAGHFNALFVQVRKRGDAYYASGIEPCAVELAPDYDPLAELLRAARQGEPRIEVHAWLVTYPVWNNRDQLPPQTNHVARLHPEWFTRSFTGETWDGRGYVLEPSHPAVQQHLFDVTMDLIRRYPVDGVQLDYIRYSGRRWGYHPVAVRRFNQRFGRVGQPPPEDADWLQFRRDQVTGLVRKIYLSAIAHNPQIKVSAATICFAPGPTNAANWARSAAFTDKLQDWRGWLEEGILDLNVPMAYLAAPTHATAWERWSVFGKEHRYQRHLALGVGTYLNSLPDALGQMRSTRQATPAGDPADGLVCYSYAGPGRNQLSRRAFIRALTQPGQHPEAAEPIFGTTAAPPPMGWKTTPQLGHLKGFVRTAVQRAGLDGAIVELFARETAPPHGLVRRELSADATGFFGAADLPPGDYRLKASAAGLEFRTAFCRITAGSVTTVVFDLAPPVGEDF